MFFLKNPALHFTDIAHWTSVSLKILSIALTLTACDFPSYMLKFPNKLGIEGIYCNIIKAIKSNPTTNITFNSKKLKFFALRSGTRLGCPLFPFVFTIVLEILARAIRQKEKGDIQPDGKSKNVSTYRWHNTICRKP